MLLLLFLPVLVTAFDPGSVGPGTKGWGYTQVIDNLATSLKMPVMVINGHKAGPTFTVTGGTYPTEYCGVEAAGRLYQQIDPQQLTGKVIIIPVVNMQVLQFRTPMFALSESVTPNDGKMLASVFPGLSNGTTSDVLAHTLFTKYILNATYHVDLRGGDLPESHLTHTIFVQGVVNINGSTSSSTEMDKTTKAMGTVFGAKYCRESRPDVFDTKPGTLIYEAVRRGVASIISEAGQGYNPQPTEEDVLAHVTGVTNLLKWSNMLAGTPEPPSSSPQEYLAADLLTVTTPVAGIFKHSADRGDLVKAGDVIGSVADLDGTVLASLRAPRDAVVHEMMPRRVVSVGDSIYHLAVITGPVQDSARARLFR